MAERSGYNRNQGKGRAQKSERRPIYDAFGFDIAEPAERQSVTTNSSLLRQPDGSIATRQLGLSVNHIELGPKKISLTVEGSQSVIRLDDSVPGESLSTVESLAGESFVIDRKGEVTSIDGSFLLDVATGLIIDDAVVAFRRPDLDYRGRGDTGATGLGNDLPGHQALEENNQEHFIIGLDKKGQEVIVAVDTGESAEAQQRAVLRAKERIVKAQRAELEQKMSADTVDAQAIKKLTERITYLSKSRPINLLKTKKLPSAVEGGMQTIETRINGPVEKREQIKGQIKIDGQKKIATVMQMSYIKPSEQGIKVKEIIDGLGQHRELRYVTAPDRALHPDFNLMISAVHQCLRRPETIQAETGEIKSPSLIEGARLRDPYAVPSPEAGFIQRTQTSASAA